jgi:methylated-DNA-protein-cysteine methyltransferase related protein
MEKNKENPTYFELVFAVTRLVPQGRVTTYGAIANFLVLGSSRMVGWALNKSFHAHKVPAHRVVNRLGELSGRSHFPTPTMMQQLLENEGIKVENDKIVDLQKHLWLPSMELGENWEMPL